MYTVRLTVKSNPIIWPIFEWKENHENVLGISNCGICNYDDNLTLNLQVAQWKYCWGNEYGRRFLKKVKLIGGKKELTAFTQPFYNVREDSVILSD